MTDRAARARISTETRGSLLVEAGAGSGKTHEMAARMAAGVAEGVYDLEHMAAVTFTRKAAAELRGRFHLALERELAETADPERRARILHAVSNLERFFAGTIHSFCARLLRERPIDAHVSPGFTELDEVEDRLLSRQSWRDYRSEARAAGDPDLALLSESGMSARDLDKAFETVCLHEDVEFRADDVPAPDGTPAWAALERFWSSIEPCLPPHVPDDTTCPTQQKAARFRRDWRFAQGGRRTPARLAELLDLWSFEPKIVQKWWADDTATKKKIAALIPALHQAFRDEVAGPWLVAWRQHLYAPAVRVLCRAREHAARDRRRRNLLNFNDLLRLTARVLRESSEVRAALRRKYRFLFVDEFQDTDPLQAEIMRLLAGRGDGATDEPRGCLFVVGDPKQSIYRFRRADISIYNDVRRELGGADGRGVVALTTNFRSLPVLCDWANAVFAAMLPPAPDTWQAPFAPLVPYRTSLQDGEARFETCGVRTLTIPAHVGQSDVITDEAARIARYIRAEVDAGRREYSDFLILTRRKKGRLQPYARALEALQVPVEVSGAAGFGESTEVQALAQLLVALADPQDSVALVGVLRGPLFGLSDRQLFAYRQAGGYLSLFDERPDAGGPAKPVGEALASLRRWYKWTRALPAAAALDRVLEDSGCLAWAAASPGGIEAGDLLHAVDRVRSAVEVGFTLAEAAETLTDEELEANDIESLPLEPGRRDVVRLMNLHKAKGLEAPVVFLADPLGGFEPRVDVHVVREGSTALGYFQIRKEFGKGEKALAEPPGWAAHEAEERRFLDAEATRLLYVAATRARDTLIVGCWAKSGWPNRRAWAAFDPYLTGLPELVVPETVTTATPAVVECSAKAARAAADAAGRAHERVRQATWSAASVTAEIKHLPRLGVASGEQDDEPGDPTRVVTADTPSRRADAGMAWGSLVHGLLEHAMRHAGATREDLRRLARWLTVDDPDLRPVIEQALDTVQAVARASFWAQARASSEAHEEVPFAVGEQDGAGPKVVNGAIDLVYRTADDWRIVDYKTDRDAEGGTLAARYAEQVAAYERAWKKVSGGAVASAIVPARSREDAS